MKSGHLFCAGLGYSALHLARRLSDAGWQVSGTTRTVDKQHDLCAEGFEVFQSVDGVLCDDAVAALGRATHLLDSIAPVEDKPVPILHHHADRIVASENLQWAGYLSTTGVYGDRGGAWVDESSELRPGQARTVRRARAEEYWRIMHERYGLPVHIFRLAGIYGPGRGVLEQIRRGRARRIVKQGQVFSRIHVDDIATTLRASFERPRPGAVYNVCDDLPEEPHRVVSYGCQLLGVDEPAAVNFENAALEGMAASFYAENKRVSNRTIRRELGVELQYPTYREGLASLL